MNGAASLNLSASDMWESKDAKTGPLEPVDVMLRIVRVATLWGQLRTELELELN